jgi:hypothetical protein
VEVLTALRTLTLVTIVTALLRPVAVVPAETAPTRVLPILLDTSRSMALSDEAGAPSRLDRARTLGAALAARLGPAFRIEWLGFGDGLVRLEDGVGRPPRRGAT